jgi:hypothetical protein
MNRHIITFLTICFSIVGFSLHSQKINITNAYTENLVVHINTDFLITGESLYYSIYCLNGENNKPSPLSKIAYVELIGEGEKSFLKTKISLVEGRGAGDFFLPSTLPSGNYILIAYTKWMRNFPVENFPQQQITIINPYLKPISLENLKKEDKTIDSIATTSQKFFESNHIILSSNKKQYLPRQKVVVVIENKDPINSCKISLNVHQYDERVHEIAKALKPDFGKEVHVKSKADQRKSTFVELLPDLRGETISGLLRENVSRQPVTNTVVYLSAYGSPYVFKISRTDSEGKFYFNAKHIQTPLIQFQVERPADAAPVDVILDDEFISEYSKFKPLPFSIGLSTRSLIEKRNVYSQIENAYFIKKSDSTIESLVRPFFGTPDKVYNLDDFTRFPTMEDIFREYMYEVVVSKRNQKFVVQLMNNRNGSRFSNSPLILIDGIRVFDSEILMNYNPLLIKTISLVRSKYIYAGILFDGILSINTYKGNANNLAVSSIHKEYIPWQLSKKYYSPVYDGSRNLDKIPDYRVQLFWNPTLNLAPGQKITEEFYTSDIESNFVIEVKGINSIGAAVNVHTIIEVVK